MNRANISDELALQDMTNEGPHSVIFRMYKVKAYDGSTLWVPEAFFPYIWEGDYNFRCYEHLGQHSAANRDGMFRSGTRTPKDFSEYKDLHDELTGIGYKLKIIRKIDHERQMKAFEVQRKAWEK